MLEIIWFIAVIVCIVGVLTFVRILFRNDHVYQFRLSLANLTYEYEKRHTLEQVDQSAYRWFFDKYTYEDMLYSFKKLRLEDWYTEEEIYKIYH